MGGPCGIITASQFGNGQMHIDIVRVDGRIRHTRTESRIGRCSGRRHEPKREKNPKIPKWSDGTKKHRSGQSVKRRSRRSGRRPETTADAPPRAAATEVKTLLFSGAWGSVAAPMKLIPAALGSPGRGEQNRVVTGQNWYSGDGGWRRRRWRQTAATKAPVEAATEATKKKEKEPLGSRYHVEYREQRENRDWD